MKMNLLQYGKILFLDAQKRQFNKTNWPYIGPALKDGEMRVCLAAECLCIQECLDMYVWILQMMHDMEPQYQLSHTSIMFADELITPSVLMKLGIHVPVPPRYALSNLMLLPDSQVGYPQQTPMGFDFTGANL
jgi:hypothetical protein